MGERIIGRLTQKNQSHIYRPGECRCFHCSAFDARVPCRKTNGVTDWEIGSNTCCGGFCMSQPTCVAPDASECFVGLSSKRKNPLVEFGWDNKAPKLKCVYDLNDIDTREQMLKYETKFGENRDLHLKYCTQKVSECPYGMKACSRLKSIGEGGNDCRRWYESQPTHVQDVAVQNYCLRHDTDDCKCANRSNSETYNALKGSHFINDGCWYSPCANKSGKYLVPSQLINPNCPEKMCQILFDIIKTGNVSMENVKNDITCNFDQMIKPPKPSPVPPVVPPVVPPPEPSPVPPVVPPIPITPVKPLLSKEKENLSKILIAIGSLAGLVLILTFLISQK